MPGTIRARASYQSLPVLASEIDKSRNIGIIYHMSPLDTTPDQEGEEIQSLAPKQPLLSRVSASLRGVLGSVLTNPLLPKKSGVQSKDLRDVVVALDALPEEALTPEGQTTAGQALDVFAQLESSMQSDVSEAERDANALKLLAEIQQIQISKQGIRAVQTIRNAQEKIGGNDFCPCGSGKKFKKCCRGKEDTKSE